MCNNVFTVPKIMGCKEDLDMHDSALKEREMDCGNQHESSADREQHVKTCLFMLLLRL